MMRAFKTLLLVGTLAIVPAVATPAPARADDGSTPWVIVDDGGSETDTPVPAGTPDPDDPDGTDTGDTADGAPAPAPDNPDPGPSDSPSGGPATTTEEPAATTDTTPVLPAAPPAPPSYCEATPSADIGVSAKADQSTPIAGSMVDFAMDVFDNGPCSAPDASFTFVVPPQFELLSPDQVSTGAGSCAVTGGVGSQLITCRLGTLDKDQHVSVNISVRADKPGPSDARAEVGTSVADWNVGDNQRSEAAVTVSASPNRSAARPRMSQSRETVRAQGLLWDGRTFRGIGEFAGWLDARGGSWKRFAKNHPAAALGLNDRG